MKRFKRKKRLWTIEAFSPWNNMNTSYMPRNRGDLWLMNGKHLPIEFSSKKAAQAHLDERRADLGDVYSFRVVKLK